jgi:hypothetical protein
MVNDTIAYFQYDGETEIILKKKISGVNGWEDGFCLIINPADAINADECTYMDFDENQEQEARLSYTKAIEAFMLAIREHYGGMFINW